MKRTSRTNRSTGGLQTGTMSVFALRNAGPGWMLAGLLALGLSGCSGARVDEYAELPTPPDGPGVAVDSDRSPTAPETTAPAGADAAATKLTDSAAAATAPATGAEAGPALLTTGGTPLKGESSSLALQTAAPGALIDGASGEADRGSPSTDGGATAAADSTGLNGATSESEAGTIGLGGPAESPTGVDAVAASAVSEGARPQPDPAASPIPGVITIVDPAAMGPREIELLIPEKEFRVEGPGDAVRISFDDIDLLKVLNMAPVPLNAVDYFPSWLSGLNGKHVRLRGWMFPPLEQEGLGGFLFVRDNQICCFGREALIYDKVGVFLKSGETTSYIQGRPFDVVGRFVISAEVLDGELFLLYSIEDASVIDG